MSGGLCNKCGYAGSLGEHGEHTRPSDGKLCNYAAAPATRMTSDITWGPEIRVDGKRPEWLADGNQRVMLKAHDCHSEGRWLGDNTAWYAREIMDHYDVSAIRLPADHPLYATLSHPTAPSGSEVGPEVQRAAVMQLAETAAALNVALDGRGWEAERRAIVEGLKAVRDAGVLLPEPVDGDLIAAREAVSEMSMFSGIVDQIIDGQHDSSPIVVATLNAIRGRALAAGDR